MFIERVTKKKEGMPQNKENLETQNTTLTYRTHRPCETPFLKAISKVRLNYR